MANQNTPTITPSPGNSTAAAVQPALEHKSADTPVTISFPVVGIGASAGGLAAFEAFFSGMPADVNPGMAFVIVQHLSPDHKSLLTELVQRYTRMKVFEVEDGMEVKQNCAYIIPPNRDMALKNGRLQLFEQLLPHGQRLPIDFFFCSLAEDRREQAICIVLSGTGSDGAQGVRAVKAEGGMVMAQYPESTSYDGMPRSAIATGVVDFVVSPVEMPAQLITYVSHALGKRPSRVSGTAPMADEALKKIFVLLRSTTEHDFTLYKEKTINRRIERRMSLHQIDRIDGYLLYLQQNPDEIELLFHDLLIGVTNFFRDPEAFASIAQRVIPDLVAGKPAGALLRIWIPGCSTGEEAYSIAILFKESMEALKQTFKIQVFATDIDKRAIETARAGRYPSGIAAHVSAERLLQFFDHDETGGFFRIKKRIRDMLVFSEQDVIRDPPFSRLDMICCRNLLIYLGSELQKKLIPLFHYALNPDGALFLGTSETIGNYIDLFAPLDRKAKIYKRISGVAGTGRKQMSMYQSPKPCDAGDVLPPLPVTGANGNGLRALTEKTLLQHFAAAGILVNERGDILYLHGRTGMYLEPSPGDAGMNILKMAREGLRQNLTIALRKAGTQKKTAVYPNVRVKTNGDYTAVNVTVTPVTSDTGGNGTSALVLVIIEEVPETVSTSPVMGVTDSHKEKSGTIIESRKRIAALKQELRVKDEYLQTTVEELETSKEELQSVNEELTTVNAELQNKVADLTRTNNDMNNLLAGTGIGTVFVDNQMCIRRFTPSVTKVINLITSDIGRPVNHTVSNLVGYDHLMDDIQSVLSDLIPKEAEVTTKSGGRYLLRILPYRTLENVIEGVVITFIDIGKKLKEVQVEK